MTSEQKQQYTLRIAQANSSQLVVILYEMFFDFVDEVILAVSEENSEAFYMSLDKAQSALSELIGSLHMDVDPAPAIYQVYLYVSGRLGQVRGTRKTSLLEDPLRLMKSLYETYKKDSEGDDSPPLMDNSQKVYAGLTYGKTALSENMDEGNGNRGFFV